MDAGSLIRQKEDELRWGGHKPLLWLELELLKADALDLTLPERISGFSLTPNIDVATNPDIVRLAKALEYRRLRKRRLSVQFEIAKNVNAIKVLEVHLQQTLLALAGPKYVACQFALVQYADGYMVVAKGRVDCRKP